MDERHVAGGHVAVRTHALVAELHDLVVLRVDGDEAAVPGRRLHEQRQPSGVELRGAALRVRRQHVVREHLEAREPVGDRAGYLVEHVQRLRPEQPHMERVVDVGAPAPAGGALGDRVRDRRAGVHPAEVEMRRHAAERHTDGRVLGPEAAQILVRMLPDPEVEVRVRLDAAGHDDRAARIDDAAGLGGRPRQKQRGDRLARDRDLAAPRPVRCDDGPAAHDQVEHLSRASAGASAMASRARTRSRRGARRPRRRPVRTDAGRWGVRTG